MVDQLVANAKRGDTQAFSKLVESHYRGVYGLAYSAVGDWAAAEDIAQETFLVAWCNLSRLRTPGAFTVWLGRIARNLARNWRRSAAYRRSLQERQAAAAKATPETSAAADALEKQETRGNIWQAIESLSPKLREVVVLFYIEEQSVRDVAQAVGAGESAIKKRLERARGQLRSHFEQRWQAEMEQERQRLSPKQKAKRMLPLLALGPVNAALGKSAAASSLSLPLAVFAVTGKQLASGGIAALILALAAYWTLGGAPAAPPPPAPAPAPVAPPIPVQPETEAEAIAEILATAEPIEPEAPTEPPPPLDAPEESPGPAPGPESASEALPPIAPKEIEDPKNYGTVHGWVHDKDLNPIRGAAISLLATGLNPNLDQIAKLDDAQRDRERQRYRAALDAAERDDARRYETHSDSHGSFTISGIRFEGMAVVSASAEGYFAENNQPTLITPEGKPPEIEFTLLPGITLNGRLFNREKRPVADARIRLYGYTTGTSRRIGGWGLWHNTDPQGRFRLPLPGYGTVLLSIESPTQGAARFNDVIVDAAAYVELFYPQPASLGGHIAWSDGSPAEGVAVRVRGTTVMVRYNQAGEAVSSGTTDYGQTDLETTVDEQGAFRFDELVPNQRYDLDLVDDGGTPLAQNLRIGILQEREARVWDYRIEASIIVRGRVIGETSGQPIPGVELVHCALIDPAPAGGMNPYTASPNDNGEFLLRVTGKKGIYKLGARFYREGMSYGHSAESDYTQEIALRPGQEETVELLLPDPWQLSYRVIDRDGVPLPGVQITLRESTTGGSATRNWREPTDADGRVVLAGLPGKTSIKPTFKLDGHASVKLPAQYGGPGEIFPEETVVMYPESGIEGVLVGPDGAPLAKQRVRFTFYYGDGASKSVTITTTAAGVFFIERNVPATTAVFEIGYETSGGRAAESPVQYVSGPMAFPAGLVSDLGVLALAVAPPAQK